jgi:hypothetical protein
MSISVYRRAREVRHFRESESEAKAATNQIETAPPPPPPPPDGGVPPLLDELLEEELLPPLDDDEEDDELLLELAVESVKVVTTPAGVTLRSAELPVSATYTSPVLSTVSAVG